MTPLSESGAGARPTRIDRAPRPRIPEAATRPPRASVSRLRSRRDDT